MLKEISNSEISSVIYESPKRIVKLINDLKHFCGGERELVVLKELTKRHEKHYGKNIDDVLENIDSIEFKGELTLVIGGMKRNSSDYYIFNKELLKQELIDLIDAGLSHSVASSYLSKKLGKPKNEIYRLLIGYDIK